MSHDESRTSGKEEPRQPQRIERYSYRSFDRQYILADNRLGDFLRPTLWEAHSNSQVYLSSLLTKPLGTRPALTACAQLPDLDYFSGRRAKDVIPFFRDAAGKEPNILPGILESLAKSYRRKVSAEDFLAYVYGILAHPAFTERYADELTSRELRVPITTDASFFIQARDVGAKLLWLHTYGERFVSKDRPRGQLPKGKARSTKPVSGSKDQYPADYRYDEETKTLTVGDGAFSPVDPDVYNFEVSGLKVVQSWLGYRMKKPKGKKSSPLDEILPEKWTGDFTTELLELLWILEATIELYPIQAKLLSEVAKKRTLRL
ncbi:MAG: type ISP restriction/modification enzyme [Pirellulales bacterium]